MIWRLAVRDESNRSDTVWSVEDPHLMIMKMDSNSSSPDAGGDSNKNTTTTTIAVDHGTAQHQQQSTKTTTHKVSPPCRMVSNIDQPIHKIGIFGSSSNLINSILGAGIIGIPYAIQQSGFIVGLMLLIIVGIFTDKSLRMLVELALYHPLLRDKGVLTYEDLITIPFGRVGRTYILISMFILAYGAMVAYLLVIKDNVPDILGLGESFIEREGVMFITSLIIMLPLSFCRDISELACTSMLSVMADVVLVVIVCVYAPVQETVSNAGGIQQVIADNWINNGLFIGLGVLSTALACQQSSFLISGTLQNPTPKRWSIVTGFSLSLATCLCVIFGIVGYLGFLDSTEGDVLRNFGEDVGIFVNTARGLLSVTMFLTFPMESFVARHVISQIFYNGTLDDGDKNNTGQATAIAPQNNKWLYGRVGRREYVTFGLYVFSLIPALIVDDLGPVLSLTGSLGASSVAYIAPGLIYIGLNGHEFAQWATGCTRRGDSNIIITNIELEGTAATTTRPWWWWPTLMPLWVTIAEIGAHGCDDFLEEDHINYKEETATFDESAVPGPGQDGDVAEEDGEGAAQNSTIRPNYIYSIVFIAFGVVAAVAGVVSIASDLILLR